MDFLLGDVSVPIGYFLRLKRTETTLDTKKYKQNKGIAMSLIILRKFHPFALLISLALFYLMIQNLSSNVPLSEKFVFLAFAGAIYITVILFESWRINQK